MYVEFCVFQPHHFLSSSFLSHRNSSFQNNDNNKHHFRVFFFFLIPTKFNYSGLYEHELSLFTGTKATYQWLHHSREWYAFLQFLLIAIVPQWGVSLRIPSHSNDELVMGPVLYRICTVTPALQLLEPLNTRYWLYGRQ